TADGVTFANEYAATTTFTMPAKAVTVTATYKDLPTYAVTVEDGTGGGSFAEGATVTITANEAPEGKEFDKWTTDDGVEFEDENEEVTTFIMPAKAVTVTATYKDLPPDTYLVTVNSGTGGGNFAEGATVTITANEAPEGKEFDKWTTDDGVDFEDENEEATTFIMPAKAVTVTATYKDLPPDTYLVTVNSGTGGGSFAEGATVSITADEAPEGKEFDKWVTDDGVEFEDENEEATTFIMPAKAVTVTATYKDLPPDTYLVTVNSGTGDGNFAEGATVSITANEAPEGKEFDKWTTDDGVDFEDENEEATTFIMPAKAVTVTATYKDLPPDTYLVTVEYGTGDGNFAEGATVTITANAPELGKQFARWELDPTTIELAPGNTLSSNPLSLIMPAAAVTATAIYEAITCPEDQELDENNECKPVIPTCPADEELDENNECKTTPIFNRENPVIGVIGVQTIYYTLKGEPLGNAKPATPGVYIEKQGKQTKRIVVK
ncbi:MAG: hypothetical protein FWH22_02415, partial [Fibromonadales bacterium]|nr:hypothetical protein [Fibromonadales bacterium]